MIATLYDCLLFDPPLGTFTACQVWARDPYHLWEKVHASCPTVQLLAVSQVPQTGSVSPSSPVEVHPS